MLRKEEQEVMPAGRPSKYDKKYVNLLLDYMKNPIDETFPTLAGFACTIEPCRDTLHEWSRAKIKDENGNLVLKYPEFSDAYKKIKDIQERNIVHGALTGKYNPTFSIFFAKNNLGYKDQQTQEHIGADGGPIQTQNIIFKAMSEDDE